ncbi:hypothetical protein [uncultured Jannaschia sp.]|uniref:hypothetical protein n=1 Tax=uncultured Jannaschia sp. TaxID=293347 RepID=UPI0026325C5D|nr:hypothetical protein [uncultured Jannaschia sp.]
MDFLEQQVETSKVAQVCGVTPNVLHGYLKRGLIVGHSDTGVVTGGGKRGVRKQFSIFNVMEVAIARELIDAGVGGGDPVAAFKAALHFAHGGSGGSGWIGDAKPLTVHRLPGLPFPPSYGLTILAVGNGNARTFALPAEGITAFAFHARLRHALQTSAFTIIDATSVFQRISTRLGFEPGQVLREAYGRNN